MPEAFSNKKYLLLAGLSLVTILLLSSIVFVAMLVGQSDSTQSDTSAANKGSAFDTGTVSKLTGGVSSYRNLKGLTLRINQIDTCDPTRVTAYVSVSSEAGDVSTSFKKTDVSVYVDGVKISDFELSPVNSSKSPLTNMLLIDHSGSMTAEAMQGAKDAAKQYVGMLQPGDKAGVIQFDHLVEPIAALTTDKVALSRALDSITPRGDTAIFDGIASGIDAVPNCGRKTVTVLTDGEDTASKSSTKAYVIDSANRKNMPIFAVGIKSPNFDPTDIREISEKSGGVYLEADTPAKVASLYSSIDGQLKGQFAANFRMPLKKTGATHTIRIVSTVEGSDTGSERVFIY